VEILCEHRLPIQVLEVVGFEGAELDLSKLECDDERSQHSTRPIFESLRVLDISDSPAITKVAGLREASPRLARLSIRHAPVADLGLLPDSLNVLDLRSVAMSQLPKNLPSNLTTIIVSPDLAASLDVVPSKIETVAILEHHQRVETAFLEQCGTRVLGNEWK
jgi:hypothetical protein